MDKLNKDEMEKNVLFGILNGISFPVLYKISYIANYFKEPLLKEMELRFKITHYEVFSILFLAYADGITASDICEFSGHLKNNISRAISSLETKGLVIRIPDEADARKMKIFITSAGRELHESIAPLFSQREHEFLCGLNPHEIELLERFLRKVCAGIPK